MSKKTFEISGSGLRNIIFTTAIEEEKFKFIIGDKEIEMRRIFADFISPVVSQIHRSDPTIDFLSLNDFIQESKREQISEILSPDLIDNLQSVSSGQSIDIDEKMCQKLRVLSILIGNEEILNKINQLFPHDSEKEKINDFIQYLELFNEKLSNNYFYDDHIFEYLSGCFHSIDEQKLLKLSKPILYLIISNSNLKVKSEDSLFEFINKFFSKENEIDETQYLNRIEFYEYLDISALSQDKFEEFIEQIDPNKITRNLWEKLKKCFFYSKQKQKQKITEKIKKEKNENSIKIEYDNNPSNRFKGIITYLGDGNSKKVIDNNIVEITSSSVVNNCENYQPICSIEYDVNHYDRFFYSSDNKDSDSQPWLCFDFKQNKVKPSQYSVRSIARSSNNYNICNWDVEGSNDGNSWKTLDSRRNEKSLDAENASNTFKIQNHLDENEFYRYLRILNIGPNANGTHQLIISSLEYFGEIKKS